MAKGSHTFACTFFWIFGISLNFFPSKSHAPTSDFLEALSNLGKVVKKHIEMNLSLSHEKFEFLMNAGTILGHSIS